jgi:hypothetical protein
MGRGLTSTNAFHQEPRQLGIPGSFSISLPKSRILAGLRWGVGGFEFHDWGNTWLRKRADEQNELPTLILRQAILERGHGPAAFADLVENFAVGDRGHALRVGEIGGKRGVCPGFRTVAFAVLAVALSAIV